MASRNWLASIVATLALCAPITAAAQGELVVYCTVQEEWCRPMVAAFEKATGIKVLMTRKSSGEFYAQIQAESANPRGDIWWGGTGDPHMQAAEEGLTIEYQSPNLPRLHSWAVRQWEQAKHRAVGVYAGALGYGYNTEQMNKKVVAPCEGTGYEIGSMSIIKSARNLDNAKKWYDWALSAEAQALGGQSKSYQVPSNKEAKPPPQAPDFSQIKFIDYDFAKYGSSAERKRLLAKWDTEVKNLPR